MKDEKKFKPTWFNGWEVIENYFILVGFISSQLYRTI